jgi:glucose/arabinose dehydrogenase
VARAAVVTLPVRLLFGALVLCAACVDRGADVGPLDPNGQRPEPDTSAPQPPPDTDAEPGPDTPVTPPSAPLRLRFEPVDHDAGALRITDLAFLPAPFAGHLLVCEKDGELIHLKPTAMGGFERLGAIQLPETWFDSDAGLISVAVDPGFDTNRFIYLGFTTSMETSAVRRYAFDADDYAATAASGVTILEVTGEGSPRSWHNVGSIGFTEQGYLWALFGDKVLDAYAQDADSPLGSILRVIPSRSPDEGGYTIPDDNPFADGGGHPAVWAKGFRSPWKGHYRDGTYFVGDVGLNSFEELNRVAAPGQRFGWPIAEGPCPADLDCAGQRDPWVAYGRAQEHPFRAADLQATGSRLRSVYVGWQYAPNAQDPYLGRWTGVLTFGDAFAGWIRGVRVAGPEEAPETWHVGHLEFATAWAQAPDGYVYVTALGTWPADGPVVLSPIYRAVLED